MMMISTFPQLVTSTSFWWRNAFEINHPKLRNKKTHENPAGLVSSQLTKPQHLPSHKMHGTAIFMTLG